MIYMVSQVQQAISPKAAAAPAPPPPQARDGYQPKPNIVQAQLDVGYVSVKLVMEEKPRRLPLICDKPPKPGLTELTEIALEHVTASAGLAGDPPGDRNDGLSMKVEVDNLSVLDLQGCVEHRNVLVANRKIQSTLSSWTRIPHSESADGSSQGKPPSALVPTVCRLELTCTLPAAPSAPMQLTVRVDDPCITLLRRFINNLAYAAGVIVKTHTDAAGRYARAAASAAGTKASPAGGPRTAQDAPPGNAPRASLAPEVMIQVNNLVAVLPAGVVARKDPIRRATQNDALVLNVRSLTLCVPGGSLALRLKQLVAWSCDLPLTLMADCDDSGQPVNLAWMAHEADINGMIASSLGLGVAHFPQYSQPAPQGQQPSSSSTGAGTDQHSVGRTPQQPVVVQRTPSSRGNMLQKQLQAAKHNILDPLKEILHEAGLKRNKRQDGIVARERDPDVPDPEIDDALRLLADLDLQQLQRLIDPAHLNGVIFTHTGSGSIQLHVKAPDGMVATLGPKSYDRMLKVLTDNVVEAKSCFEVGTVGLSSSANRNTAFNPKANFGPRPGQLPFFHLTVDWPDCLQAALESNPAWWEGKRESPTAVEPCLQACFTKCSLGLMMMKDTGDMHLAFHSQELHVADVRISSHLDAVVGRIVDAAGLASIPDTSVDVAPSLGHRHSDSSVPEGEAQDEYYETQTEEAHGTELDGLAQEDQSEDGSMETPEVVNIQPVIDELPAKFPGKQAVVSLIRSGINLPADEATHLARHGASGYEDAGECPRDGSHNCMRVSFAMFQDGTMSNEIELCHTLIQWPYLTEMSLISSIISIFLPTWGHPVMTPEAGLRLMAAPWLYFNLVLRDSQLFIPILTPHLRRFETGWRGATDAAEEQMELTAAKLQQLFARMVAGDSRQGPDLAPPSAWHSDSFQLQPSSRPQLPSLRYGLASSGMPSVQSHDEERRSPRDLRAGLRPDWAADMSSRRLAAAGMADDDLRLEETGLVLTMSALRIGHFAGFVRHRGAQVTCWLLPIRNLALEMRCSMQLVEESKVLQKFVTVARMLVFQLKTRKTARRVRRTRSLQDVQQEQPSNERSVTPQRPSDGGHPAGGVFAPGGDDLASIRSKRFKPEEGKGPLVTLESLLSRKTMVTAISLKLDTAVFRGSFSNIPLWHSLVDDLGLASSLMIQNNGLFASWSFRPSSTALDVDVKSLAIVLCDDKPKSYGAPDILTAAAERLVLQYTTDKRYLDHMPEQSGCLSLLLSAQFLNNSTGRWEHLMEPWPAEVHLSDPINPIFKSSRTKYIFMTSSQLLKLNFHPSCLLTIGDSLQFSRQLFTRSDASLAEAVTAEKAPSPREQMALGGSIMSRVPQRYLIQNMTGMLMSYWAPPSEHEARPQGGGGSAPNKKTLRPGCSEELRITPTAKEVKIVGPGGVVNTRLSAQVIVLKFEGNWLPIPDVSVDVVGKYCYSLRSPHNDRNLPVIVDVVLVGRTKILKIHSALYIQNNTAMKIGFRLHLPSAPLTRQIVLANGDVQLPGDQDIRLRPLHPGKGRYLPVVAALDGVLYMEPHKHLPAEHDVIRLFPAVSDIAGQSGFIACGPPLEGTKGPYGQTPIHFAVKVKVKSRTEYSYTTFNSMEVPGPGEFAKASRPLEASIKITPTTIITNSLPYRMEGYLITLSGSDKVHEANPATSGSAPAVRENTAHGDGGSPDLTGRASGEGAPWKLSRQRHGEEALAQRKGFSGVERVMAELRKLAGLLKPDLSIPSLKVVDQEAIKVQVLAILRFELRWALKRGVKEMELLARTDNEAPDKISWQDIGAFVEWAQRNVRRVLVHPGGAQHHYVDMRKQAVLCVKVPELKMVCTRPIELNHGTRTAGAGDAEQLPEYMRLMRVEEPESLEAIQAEFCERKEKAAAAAAKADNVLQVGQLA
ncbi:hypothetical protein GPECTOR_38g304 [Gonium pectorale]|uniref:Uncharacterized protein n=1 Tax=Gonium pectorale TaxID=33097 RepID=A0A150GB41_GONPE|nr:hypothetical protein GPECTOR_38g304 [Gonium pectorale]|eukprot:KXZ47067.1 hypothetical protein GPECTOR_38g304 [Gonium pectorale]